MDGDETFAEMYGMGCVRLPFHLREKVNGEVGSRPQRHCQFWRRFESWVNTRRGDKVMFL